MGTSWAIWDKGSVMEGMPLLPLCPNTYYYGTIERHTETQGYAWRAYLLPKKGYEGGYPGETEKYAYEGADPD